MQLLSFINQKLIKKKGDLNMEEFFKNYQYTFSGIGAIGSAGAVIISLWLARKQNVPKIEATFSLAFDIQPSSPTLLSVSIVNKGILPVFIPNGFLQLRIPFGGFKNEFNKILDFSSEASKYPFKLESRKSETFIIGEKNFLLNQFQKIKKEVGLLRFYFVRVEVAIEDGSVFNVKGGSKFIRSLVKK